MLVKPDVTCLAAAAAAAPPLTRRSRAAPTAQMTAAAHWLRMTMRMTMGRELPSVIGEQASFAESPALVELKHLA